jgi:hypothetical protein
LTPETETSCFYFWSCGNGYRQNDPETTEQLYREIAPTFVEDKDMVEAQQTRLDEFRGKPGSSTSRPTPTACTCGRMVERLIAAGTGRARSGVAREERRQEPALRKASLRRLACGVGAPGCRKAARRGARMRPPCGGRPRGTASR